MKIAIATPQYFPIVGGTSTIVHTLASAVQALGHETTVVTFKGDAPATTSSIAVVQVEGFVESWRAFRGSDGVIVIHPSLKLGVPARLACRRVLIAHHGWLEDAPSPVSRILRRMFLRSAPNVVVSTAVASTIPAPSTVIPNAYQSDLFCEKGDTARPIDVLFVGRMCESKGIGFTLEVMARLQSTWPKTAPPFQAALVGPRREDFDLDAALDRLGLSPDIYRGPVTLEGTADYYRAAKITLMPSPAEPFGLVALEAMASGSVLIASRAGGLLEAVGEAGELLHMDDVEPWVDACFRFLQGPDLIDEYRRRAREHLVRFQPEAMARRYLDALFGRD